MKNTNREIEPVEVRQRYQQECVRRNCASFKIFTMGGMMIAALIFVRSALSGQRSAFMLQYVFFFLYMTLLHGVSCLCSHLKPRYITGIYYAGLLPVYLVAILMGTVFDSDRPAITIMVFLCGLTLFIIDRPWRLLGYITCIGVGFTLISYYTKAPEVFNVDLVNIQMFGMIGLALNYLSLKDRRESVRNFLLTQESRKQQEMIISNLPTGIIVFKIENGTYHIVQVNPAICRMMNIDPDKALLTSGKHILKLMHPDDAKIVYDASAQLMVPGTEVHYEFRNLNRTTNTYSWTSADGKSVKQPDGSVLVYIGYADINVRKEKEEEYKRRISALAEMDDENLIAKGQHNLTQNKVMFFEPKMECAARVADCDTYDAAVSALTSVILTKQQREEMENHTGREALLAGFRQGETDGSLEFRRLTPDGQTIWSKLRYSVFEEPNTGDVIAFMYSYDVTERIMERKIVSKLGNMEYDMFGIIDAPSGRYALLNQLNHIDQKMLVLDGSFNEKVQGRILSMVVPENREEVLQKINLKNVVEQLECRDVISVMYTIFTEAGRRLRKRFQFTYLDETKDIIIFFRSDITELYEKEQEQLARTEAALKAAEIASSAKTEFFSRMSHDMRTPMNGILGLANLSRDEENLGVLKENIEKIQESGEYLLGLINDTLDFQRIESGRLTLEPQAVKAKDIVENTIDMVRETARAKGVTLLVSHDSINMSSYIMADLLRIKQIFVNLLSNAIKFTPSGGTVEFSVKVLSEEGSMSRNLLMIRDTGIGMSEEFLRNRIFKPFSQESNQITAQYAGSGLGLSIAKSLVEMMGGTIEVQSKPGAGTTFLIQLDFELVDLENVQAKSDIDRERTKNIRDRLRGRRILLVEDHPLNAEVCTKLLQRAGAVTDWLQNGAEALNYFQSGGEEIYDAVLMDIRMPVMNGMEAAKKIRQLDSTYAKTVPIIAMTANAYEEDIRQSAMAGMNAHLSKPIEPEKLYRTLVQYAGA